MTEANEELGGGKGRDYDVGYGKGAPETLWKKGQSGNPSGKKKEEPEISGTPDDPDGIGKMLQDLDNELVVVLFGKKKVRMPRVELRLRQMFDKAIKGGLKQARQVYLLAVKYYAPEALGDSSHSHVYKSDMAELTGDEPADRDVDLSERSQSKKARAKRGPAQTAVQVSEGATFRYLVRQKISIEIFGKKRKLFRWQALLRQLYDMALEDNSSAARLLNQIRNRFPGNLPQGDHFVYVMSEEDRWL